MSMVASKWLRAGSAVSSIRVPLTPLKPPFTLEIIMCFTLNSARECAGSTFQVIVAAGIAVVVVMVITPMVWCVCEERSAYDRSTVGLLLRIDQQLVCKLQLRLRDGVRAARITPCEYRATHAGQHGG